MIVQRVRRSVPVRHSAGMPFSVRRFPRPLPVQVAGWLSALRPALFFYLPLLQFLGRGVADSVRATRQA